MDRRRKITSFNYLDLAPDSAITAGQVLAETPGRFLAALQRQVVGDACLGASEVKPNFWSLWQKEDYHQLFEEYFRSILIA